MAFDWAIAANYQTVPGAPSIIKEAMRARIFFVDSNGGGSTTSGGRSPESAFTTLAAAIAACTASKGDVIYVLPGHSESLSGATALNINIAGISICGVGNRLNRPLFTWHTTDAKVTISAANVRLFNLQVATDVDAVVSMFNVTAAGVVFDGVDFVDTAACAPLQFLLTNAGGDDLTIVNTRHVQTASAAISVQAWIGLVGADRFFCKNNYWSLKGAASTAANGHIVGATTLSADVFIDSNRFVQANSTGAIPISMFTGSTGSITNNHVASPKTAIAGQVACASCYAMNNFANNTVNLSGLLDPAVDS